MARKVIVSMLAVFVVIALASLGYKFGQYLAKHEARPSPVSPA